MQAVRTQHVSNVKETAPDSFSAKTVQRCISNAQERHGWTVSRPKVSGIVPIPPSRETAATPQAHRAPKWRAFRGKAAKQRPGPKAAPTKAHSASRPQGRKRRESGGPPGLCPTDIPQHRKDPLSQAPKEQDKGSFHVRGRPWGKAPAGPGFPVGVLDLVGLSTYRHPAGQRWQQR